MNSGLSEDYITLQEAATMCEYSQEYLSLRARQGKLQAVKFGRNWLTTLQWLRSYTEKVREYKRIIADKSSNPAIRLKFVEPPFNLPIEWKAGKESTDPEFARSTGGADLLVMRKFIGSFVAVVVLLSFTLLSSSELLKQTGIFDFSSATGSVSNSMPETDRNFFLNSSVGEIGRAYIHWLSESASELAAEIATSIYGVHETIGFEVRSMGKRLGSRFVNDDKALKTQASATVVDALQPQVKEDGLLVVPSSGDNEELKAHIQKSFSDEVEIVPTDDESGIITPVFRQTKGQKYFYILVPLQES